MGPQRGSATCGAGRRAADPAAAMPRAWGGGSASGGFPREGPRADSVALPSALASSDWCRVNCQDGRVGADFTRGNGRDPMNFHSVSLLGKPALTVTLHK